VLEADAKKKDCPHFAAAQAIMTFSMTYIYVHCEQTAADDAEYAKTGALFNQKCRGSGCMMWEPVWTTESKECLDPEKPEGEGWRQGSSRTYRTAQRDIYGSDKTDRYTKWHRTIDSGHGDCGLKRVPGDVQ
jgi:hypothetical protein